MTATAAQGAPPATLHERLRRVLAPATIVLAYHRVVPHVERDVNRLQVSCEHFAAQIEWLATAARPLTADEFTRAVPARHRPTLALNALPRVLITFDDGYADNIEHALPILTRAGVDATIFVTTAYAESGEPYWWDALAWAVCADDTADSRSRYALLHESFKPLDASERRARLAELGAVGAAPPDCRPARWDELVRWRDSGRAIGVHTRTHAQLSACDDSALVDEIAGARADIQNTLGIEARMIAYPYGTRGDFDGRAERVAASAGFDCGLANWPGNVRWARNAFALPRQLVRDWDLPAFIDRFRTWCSL